VRIHTIDYKDDTSLLYLPDKLKFYLANKKTVKLAELICEGKSLEEVVQIFPDIVPSLYESVHNTLKVKNREIKSEVTEEWIRYLPRLVIHISNSCNLKCKYCYAHGGNYLSEKGMMSLELLDKILDSFYTIFDKIDAINLFGGEPSLNIPAIERVAKYISDNNIDTQIGMITNGTLVTDKLASLIAEYNINVTFSVDQKDMQDILRPYTNDQGTHTRIKANAEKLKKISDQPSHLEVVYTKEHVNRGVSIVDVLKQIRSDFGKLPVHLTPVQTDDLTYKLEDEDAFMQSVDDVFANADLDVESDYSFTARIISSLKNKNIRNNFCPAGFGTVSISVK